MPDLLFGRATPGAMRFVCFMQVKSSRTFGSLTKCYGLHFKFLQDVARALLTLKDSEAGYRAACF